MIILISPAKTFSKMNKETDQLPAMMRDTKILVSALKKLSANDFRKHMKISDNIASTVYDYYHHFGKNLNQAIFTYDGYQYKALNASSMNHEELEYLENHLYIVSGLYGLVKPFDGISYYRLEMKDHTVNNLYAFWNPKFKKYIKKHHQDDVIIDLMSGEYRKAFQDINRIEIDFYEISENTLRSISMHVKRIRGLFAKHLITNQIEQLDAIKLIEIDGYCFNESLSNDTHFIYTKEVNTDE
jgi:cytoplasmic iron level regulating protein YaaA (DUF328/UPF0246 family)